MDFLKQRVIVPEIRYKMTNTSGKYCDFVMQKIIKENKPASCTVSCLSSFS
jgi:hypothetical protein